MPNRTQVLDHGYVELVEHWGSDERIIEAARMSTDKGFLGWGPKPCSRCGYDPREDDGTTLKGECCPDGEPHQTQGDEKLLKYLWDNKHHTPFEMAGFTIEVMAPIFVFREWHRHRVPFGYNEMSARYVPLPDVNYVPSVERLLMNSKTNKQAGTIKGADELTPGSADQFREALKEMYKNQETMYQWWLECGVPKELARIHLPVGRHSRMRATSNLRGWLAFLSLRMASGAQWEIRQYANEVGKMVGSMFPRTWALFVEGREGAK